MFPTIPASFKFSFRARCQQNISPEHYLRAQVEKYLSALNRCSRIIEPVSFRQKQFNAVIDGLISTSAIDYDKNLYSGFIRRLEVPIGTRFFVQADLHGDLASLVCLLEALQNEGFLDENYVPKEGHYLVFLGNYTDKGSHNLEVLFLLVLLRKQSDQVILLRGDNENPCKTPAYMQVHKHLSYDDQFEDYLRTDANVKRLSELYLTFPDALYATSISNKPQYVIFCCGLPPYHFDPQLEYGAGTTQFVPRERLLSERLKTLNMLDRLAVSNYFRTEEVSSFLIGSIKKTTNVPNNDFNASDVQKVLYAQSEEVGMILRGRDQALRQHVVFEETQTRKVVALTLPPTMGGYYRKLALKEGERPVAMSFVVAARLSDTVFRVFMTEVFGFMQTSLLPNKFLFLK